MLCLWHPPVYSASHHPSGATPRGDRFGQPLKSALFCAIPISHIPYCTILSRASALSAYCEQRGAAPPASAVSALRRDPNQQEQHSEAHACCLAIPRPNLPCAPPKPRSATTSTRTSRGCRNACQSTVNHGNRMALCLGVVRPAASTTLSRYQRP